MASKLHLQLTLSFLFPPCMNAQWTASGSFQSFIPPLNALPSAGISALSTAISHHGLLVHGEYVGGSIYIMEGLLRRVSLEVTPTGPRLRGSLPPPITFVNKASGHLKALISHTIIVLALFISFLRGSFNDVHPINNPLLICRPDCRAPALKGEWNHSVRWRAHGARFNSALSCYFVCRLASAREREGKKSTAGR